jgi:hypothetical protein
MINNCISIITLSVGLTFSSLAQNLTISVDHTEPRLGQEINLSLQSDFFNEFLEDSFSDSFELWGSYLNEPFTRTIVVRRLGSLTIGPIQFEFNGKKYSSNSISLNVLPDLPEKEGVWIRKLRIDSTDFILIEQITGVQAGNSSDEKLTRLIKEPSEVSIRFSEWRSGSGVQPNTEKSLPPSLKYSYRFYEIRKGEEFTGKFKLKEIHFTDLPKGVKIPEIIID